LIAFVVAMWNRDGYGMVASRLIQQFPLFGVGIGSFHLLVPDYFLRTGLGLLNPDNAQNWYRHQLVELGLVGSLGWILFVVSFARFVLSKTLQPSPSRIVVRGVLVAVAVVSLVGMPTQNVAVAIAFWMLAFWFVLLTEPGAASDSETTVSFRGWTWAAIWTMVALTVGGTAYSARHRLRVPQRAVAFGWGYAYGFANAETEVAVTRPSVGWVGRHAVAVLAPSARLVKLTISVEPLNLAKGPVDVNVSCDGEPVLVGLIVGPQPIIRYVNMRDGATRMLLEAWVSRSVRLANFGLGDSIERGLLIQWEFFDASPPVAPKATASSTSLFPGTSSPT